MLLVRRAGEWTYDAAGEEHAERNGVCLSGRLELALGPEQFVGAPDQLDGIACGGEPRFIEEIGCVGESRALWTRWVAVPVKPPPDADRAVAAVYHWTAGRDPFESEPYRRLAYRYLSADVRDGLLGPGGACMAAKEAIFQRLAHGAFGRLHPDDQAVLDILNANISFETNIPIDLSQLKL
jgi:hypothetical protein